MKVEHPHAKAPTPEEIQHLEELKSLVDRIAADGRLSRDEEDTIRRALYADKKVTPEELQIVRTAVWDKMREGRLEIAWSSTRDA